MPELSIIMPVFNQEKFITESIKSILNQTYKDFELLIINDGSTDNTKTIICNDFKDNRIKLIDNEANKGVIYSLNRGLALSLNSRFIARMDADDIAVANRFQVQVQFLNKNKDVGLLGSGIRFFGNHIRSRHINYPAHHKKIMSAFVCLNPFAHPTVVFRASLISDNNLSYDKGFPRYEDYAMWMNFISKTRFANIDKALLHYRRHPANITSRAKRGSIDSFPIIQKLITLYFNKSEISLPDENIIIMALVLSNKNNDVPINTAIQTILNIQHTLNEAAIDNLYLSKMLYRCFLKYYPQANYLKKAEALRKKLNINLSQAAQVWKSLILKNSFPA